MACLQLATRCQCPGQVQCMWVSCDSAAMGGDCVQGEVTLFQDAFSHFDKTKCGMLPTKMLGQLLRFVGENPSDAEVQVNALLTLTR